jgi:RNA polymerase sigma factor (sigma-70 family)
LQIDPQRPRSDPVRGGADGVDAFDLATLTRKLVAGDEAAYREFHHAYVDRLLRYLIVVTAGDEDAAREALQETFQRVVRHVRVFTDEAVFWSWLTVLARSARADQGRKRRRYLAFLDRFTAQAAVDQAGPAEPDRAQELNLILERTLAELPPDERMLLELKYFQHRPVREMAGRLQANEKAIESRLVRIRQKLRVAILARLKHAAPE